MTKIINDGTHKKSQHSPTSNREILDAQFKLAGITPEQAEKDSFSRTVKIINDDKNKVNKKTRERIDALRAIYDTCSSKSFKNIK